MEWETVRLEGTEAVRHIVLNRPRVHNAFNTRMLADLLEVVAAIEDEPRCRAVILRGEGPSFCAGADLKEGGVNHTAPLIALMRRAKHGKELRYRLGNMVPVTIAALHGHVIGRGVSLAGACDFRIAADDAKLAISEVNVGLTINGFFGDVVNLVGLGRARELFILGETHPADRMLAWGFYDQVVPRAELIPAAEALAARVEAQPPIPVQLTKQSINALARSLDRALSHANPAEFGLSARSTDGRLAREARRSGVPPVWRFE